jgi:hypothetical protein
MRELITKQAPVAQIFQAAKAQKMRTMMEDGMDKVLRGVTTPAELIHAVYTSAGLDVPTGPEEFDEEEEEAGVEEGE